MTFTSTTIFYFQYLFWFFIPYSLVYITMFVFIYYLQNFWTFYCWWWCRRRRLFFALYKNITFENDQNRTKIQQVKLGGATTVGGFLKVKSDQIWTKNNKSFGLKLNRNISHNRQNSNVMPFVLLFFVETFECNVLLFAFEFCCQ